MRFAALVRDHSNGIPASSKAAAAQQSIKTPALDRMAGRCGAVTAATTAAVGAGAGALAAAVLAAIAANGSMMAYATVCLRLGAACCCLQATKHSNASDQRRSTV